VTIYEEYKSAVSDNIKSCLRDMGCQPIIFAGSGVSKRYFGAPSWEELLKFVCKENPLLDKDYTYYKQAYGDMLSIGEAFINPYHEWAWGKGRKSFNEELFKDNIPKNIYLKSFVASYISRLQPAKLNAIKDRALKEEVELLQGVRPNSIITTNFDNFCEVLFPDYTPIIGQTIIKTASSMIGEIFKIHGCWSSPDQMIFTKSDYSGWELKKKYLSAKLLTYFLEHPVIVIGYSAQDPNVLAILRDIDEILTSKGEMVSNIYYVVYDDKLSNESNPPKDLLLNLGNGTSMRVKAIYAKDFSWIFKAFAASEGIENVNPKLLRALVSRTFELVRHDIPRATMEVNYATLEQVVKNDDSLPRLLGITSLSDPEMFNAAYPYILSGVGKKLGYSSWHQANQLIERIKTEKGVDLKVSDNQFHIAVKSGSDNFIHKYSDALVSLLELVRDGQGYDVKLKKKKA
jgi:hypothetical protein